MKQIKLTIGENNQTHEVETDKIISHLQKYFDGFTLSSYNVGFWKGQKENSITASIISDIEEDKIKTITLELKELLQQEAILYVIEDFNGVFI